MAYESKNLSALGYANGFTLWHYRTKDHASELGTPGYFNPASRMVRAGDFVLINAAIDYALVSGVWVIIANTGGEVQVQRLVSQQAA